MKKKVIEPVKISLIPPAFGEIGSQGGSKLILIRDIDEFKLPGAVNHFGRGYPQIGRPAGGDKV
jgi:hypothetical protein